MNIGRLIVGATLLVMLTTDIVVGSDSIAWKSARYHFDSRVGRPHIKLEWLPIIGTTEVRIFARREGEKDFLEITRTTSCNIERGVCLDWGPQTEDNSYYIEVPRDSAIGPLRSEIITVTVPTTVDHVPLGPPRSLSATRILEVDGATFIALRWTNEGNKFIQYETYPYYVIHRKRVTADNPNAPFKPLVTISGSDRSDSLRVFDYKDKDIDSEALEYQYRVTGLTGSFSESPESNVAVVNLRQ